MREITTHRCDGATGDLDSLLTIHADGPGPGGASHVYDISLAGQACAMSRVSFQNGPVAENGPNGVSMEALLAICIDRLRGFESGPYACAENKAALNNLLDALKALKARTAKRFARGVEGTTSQ